MKTCTKCGEEQPVSEFHKKSARSDGLSPHCKSCCKEAMARDYQLNRQERINSNKSWVENNRERSNQIKAEWRRRNPSKVNSFTAARKAKTRVDHLAPEERRAIEDLYWLARDLRAVTGEDYHVDHIRPLSKGGEHRLDNLQVLPADMNLSKGAKYG